MAMTDSLWAGSRAGEVGPALLTAASKTVGWSPGSTPQFASLDCDPKAGAYQTDDPDRQKLLTDVVALLPGEARGAAITAKLSAAAKVYLDGDRIALDQSLLSAAFGAYLKSGVDGARADFSTGQPAVTTACSARLGLLRAVRVATLKWERG